MDFNGVYEPPFKRSLSKSASGFSTPTIESRRVSYGTFDVLC